MKQLSIFLITLMSTFAYGLSQNVGWQELNVDSVQRLYIYEMLGRLEPQAQNDFNTTSALDFPKTRLQLRRVSINKESQKLRLTGYAEIRITNAMTEPYSNRQPVCFDDDGCAMVNPYQIEPHSELSDTQVVTAPDSIQTLSVGSVKNYTLGIDIHPCHCSPLLYHQKAIKDPDRIPDYRISLGKVDRSTIGEYTVYNKRDLGPYWSYFDIEVKYTPGEFLIFENVTNPRLKSIQLVVDLPKIFQDSVHVEPKFLITKAAFDPKQKAYVYMYLHGAKKANVDILYLVGQQPIEIKRITSSNRCVTVDFTGNQAVQSNEELSVEIRKTCASNDLLKGRLHIETNHPLRRSISLNYLLAEDPGWD